ncbi:MAG: exodeoxyribonuclease V subunit alpha, partial [Desulfobacterales bacterium]
YDVVVVDEASMVDLALMSKLVDAVKPGVHLILLGDKDQLASVESGSVLVDVVAALPGNAIELKKSYRFDSNIKKLAAAVNGGEYKKAWDVLTDSEHSNINLLPEGVDYIVERYSAYMERVRQFEQAGVYDDENIRELFNQFHSFQVLCVTNYGRNGIYNVSSIIERRLKNCGFPDCRTGQWYSGRPVMITSNEYNLGLYNGDVGICLLAGNTGGTKELKVWFERGDSFVALSPGRLPARQTVFAMTIHKSQGSEFADVLVMLPEDENQILCRELLYTGITRAKENVVITGSRDIWYHAVQQKVSRNSGLKAFLLQPLS